MSVITDEVRTFCERKGFTAQERHGWLYLYWGKQVAIEYNPRTGQVHAHRIAQSRYEAPSASYQVADWSGVTAIIRSRLAWTPKPKPNPTE